MVSRRRLSERVEEEVSAWEGVSAEPHRFGGVEFRLGKREIGHIHRANGMLDIPFAKKIREIVVSEGRAGLHHLLPETGWITFYIDAEAAADNAVWLLRLSYLFHLARQPKRAPETNVERELEKLDLSPPLAGVFEDQLSRRRPPSALESGHD